MLLSVENIDISIVTTKGKTMDIPIEQIVAGAFMFSAAIATGIFTLFNTRLNKKMDRVEKKCEDNDILTLENNIIEKILPVLERKDLALDKIADILQNNMRNDEFTTTRIEQLESILRNRCEAPKIIEEILRIEEDRRREGVRQDLIQGLVNDDEIDTENKQTSSGTFC